MFSIEKCFLIIKVYSQFQTCVIITLLVLSSAQDTERRARLRSLISAARSGDTEARRALQELRAQIKTRRANQQRRARPTAAPVPAPTLATTQATTKAPTTSKPTTEAAPIEVTTFNRRISQQKVIDETPVREFTLTEPRLPARRTQQVQQPFRQFELDDTIHHKTLHMGLEVDDRSEKFANIRVTNRTKTPPIQTIRRYSYFDEAGNYIFGYEAADGSFKEEKRGRDCIVHGKYGYVDPNGIRREYTYTSGNRCDPTVSLDDGTDPQPILPPNEQFLVQTQERQLDEATLQTLQFNRRRQPRPQAQQPRRPVSEVLTESVRRPSQEISRKPVIPQQIITEPPTTRPPPPPPTTRPPPPTTKAPVRFRPTPKPLDHVDFNFDQEFSNIFSHFGTNRSPPESPTKTYS